MFTPPFLILVGIAVLVLAVVFWFAKGRQMWEEHQLSVRDSRYRRDTRSIIAPRGVEQIQMALPNLQVVAHEKAGFIRDLNDDLKELVKKRADNPYRVDYLLGEHIRLEGLIRRAEDEFRFTVKTANDLGSEVGVVFSQNYEDHLQPPVATKVPTVMPQSMESAG